MPTKSSMTKPDKKKKIRISRDVPEVIINILEEVAEEVIEDVKEAVLEVVEEVVEQVEDFVENIVLSHPEPLEESRSLPPPPSDEDYDHPDCPVSPCASKKRVKKVVEPKPPRNEKGEYLNSRTNRYVKEGTSSFKQLVKDGVIILESICV